MKYSISIPIAGGDTATPRNLSKRLALITAVVPPGSAILDAGCGAGEYVAALGHLGYDARGIEYQAEKVDAWKAAHPTDSRVQRGDLLGLPVPDASVDAILYNEVLEHVSDPDRALSEARRVLKTGGRLLVLSPNRRYPFETHGLDSWRTGKRIAPIRTFGYPWLPLKVGVHFGRPWALNFWPGELRRRITRAGFRIERQTYLWQTFENISGRRGPVLTLLAPLLRGIATAAERIPLLRSFGVSQVIIAAK